MSQRRDIVIPDLGDSADVEIIELHCTVGDSIALDEPLLTLESEKASMDVPAPYSGRLVSLSVAVGDRVNSAEVIGLIETDDETTGDEKSDDDTAGVAESAVPVQADAPAATDRQTQLLVLGAGPGGYAAAFRAADLGVKVILVERWPTLGGVCLNVGCIPSKALLHAAKVIDDAHSMSEHGISFGDPDIDPVRLGAWKDSVVARLTGGLATMAKQRNVTVVRGTGKFLSDRSIVVEHDGETQTIGFEQCIIAAGSESVMLPGVPDDPRIVDSTGALELEPLPDSLLVIGGGIIGLEMACVYDALGVKVSVVELTKELMPGTDRDLVRPLQKRIKNRYEDILLGIRVNTVNASKEGVRVSFQGPGAPEPRVYQRVLVAVGRRANGKAIGLENTTVTVNDNGTIPVDRQMRTNTAHIFAIGDIAGQPMLAHKATHEGHVAAEVVAGHKSSFDARVIPSVAYTDPEIAWTGLTELEAKEQGIKYSVGKFPWAASGRSLALGRSEGFTKIIFDKASDRILGAGIVGTNAGDLISELSLAVEMGADAADVAMTIHPHPTLSETIGLAAEAYEGTITDLYMPKKA